MAFESSQVWLLRRPAIARATLAAVAALVTLVGAGLLIDPAVVLALLAGGGSILFYVAVGLIVGWRLRAAVPVPGHVFAGEEGVTWNDRRLSTREEISAGFVIPGDGGLPDVRLVRRFPRRPLTFRVPDEATGRELLSALGLDASQTIATLKLASLMRARSYATLGDVGCFAAFPASIVLFAIAATGASSFAAVALPLAFGVIAWTVLNVIPARARVGADGVLVEWLWQRRFVDFEDLASAQMFVDGNNAGVALTLRDGSEVKLPTMGLFTTSIAREELTLMVKRIEQAAEVHRRAQADRGVMLPSRGERSARDWLRALRAMGSGANADHRTAPVQPDTLFRIAEDAGTEPARRVAAAVALAGGLDAPGRERLRIAASTTAAPELREAIELAADEAASEEALAEAIDRVGMAKT